MKITSDVIPGEFLEGSSNEVKFSADLDEAAWMEAQIEFLISWVNTLRKFTGRGELSKTGSGNIKKRSNKPSAQPVRAPAASVNVGMVAPLTGNLAAENPTT